MSASTARPTAGLRSGEAGGSTLLGDDSPRRVLIVHRGRQADIRARMGQPEYSYHFVLSAMLPVLRELGEVVAIEEPFHQVDDLHRLCQHLGIPSVFLCFEPPHKIPQGLICPVLPFFAWEFADLPNQVWGGNPFNDWRRALKQCVAAVTHSQFAAEAVRRAMGNDYPVHTCPSPVWDQHVDICPPRPNEPRVLELPGHVALCDSGSHTDEAVANGDLSMSASIDLDAALASGEADCRATRLALSGVVFTIVCSDSDGRKKWRDLVISWCRVFREESSATLIVKFISANELQPLHEMIWLLQCLPEFRCRVIAVTGYLTREEYRAMIASTDFCVNVSTGEGQCLPLMEFMSAGRPAVAPMHTAMSDYVDETVGFPFESVRSYATWPHDPRRKINTVRYLPVCDSLEAALWDAHRCARTQPERYQSLSNAARHRLRSHCSRAVARSLLKPMLDTAFVRLSRLDGQPV